MIARLSSLPLLVLFAGLSPGQNFAPPDAVKPTEEQQKALKARFTQLDRELSSLRRKGVRDPFLPDVEVFHKAADWIIRHGEFYRKDYIDWTFKVMDYGLLRAEQIGRGDSPWLESNNQTIVRGYRSRIDNSVQPYAVTLPADYGRNPAKRYRLDIVLHGRNATLTEVSFLHQHADKPAPKNLDHIQIDVYGRGNNAYRWAGETDVHEAVENFLNLERTRGRDILVDSSRIVLRGFSMGGAGTWHLGLHRPGSYCVLGPGAGFTTTRGYLKSLPEKLPDHIEKCLRIYDAVDYAENVFNVPVVAFSGDDDPQKDAALNIEKRLKGTDLAGRMTHLIAPGLGHKFPPEWQAKAEAEYVKHVVKGRPDYPVRVRFVTYTLKYPICDWVELQGLENHYEKAVVDAEWQLNESRYKITTRNVRALHIGLKPGDNTPRYNVEIDGDKLEVIPYRPPQLPSEGHLYLMKRGNSWEGVWPQRVTAEQVRTPRKSPGLQGPIDDAFTAPFLCIRGTGTPWNKAVQEHAEASLKRFEAEWDKFMRGKLPVRDDVDVAGRPGETAGRHLILFGDPGSNSFIAQMLGALPLSWTKKEVGLGATIANAETHVPVLIYPSPLAFDRYVVLNSGHTFRGEDFRGTNALLYPRLGDHALLHLTSPQKDPLAVEVTQAGLFDDSWRIRK